MTKEKSEYLKQFVDLKERSKMSLEYDRMILKKQRDSYEKIEQEWLVGKGLV